MNCGFITLHRKILDWEWYDDPNVTRLFIHCLLRANHKPNNWRGIMIERGSFITSVESLSKETKLSVSQIRTAIKKLKSTSELAVKSQAQYSVVTVLEYDSYQSNDKLNSKPVTNQSQTNRKPMTTNNNDNNENNDNNGTKDKALSLDLSVLLNFSDQQISELKRIRKKNKGGSITQRVANALAKEFNQAELKGFSIDESLTEWEVRGWKSFKADWMKRKANEPLQYSDVTAQNINTLEEWINE